MRYKLFTLFLFILVFRGQAEVKYVSPDDSQPLIRRDLLPLDADAISELANHLTILADGRMPQSAEKLRHRAQILTLSQRLLPGQARAQSIEASFTKGESRPRPDNALLKKASQFVIKNAEWLSQLPDDSEGYHLGQLLLDLLHPVVPDLHILANRDAKNEAKRWNGVIAALAQFEANVKPVVTPPTPVTPAPASQSKYAVNALLTEVPMFSRSYEEIEENEKTTPKLGKKISTGLVTTALVLTESSKTDPESGDIIEELLFQPPPDFKVGPLHKTLIRFFKDNFEPLPTGYTLNVSTNKRQYLSKNRENIAANLAMMLDAAISGRSLRRNTIFFAKIRANGNLEKPLHAWELLRRLEELQLPTGTRLIVGTGLIEEMTAFLVLNKASFFTKYEVLEVATFAEARELFYRDGKPPINLQNASEIYQTVRDKAVQANNLATFLDHPAVEERLTKALEFSPNHLSVSLLTQQCIRRPAYFSRTVFAQELDRLLEPLAQFEYVIDKAPERSTKDIYKETRDELNALERLLRRNEITILDSAKSLIKKLNSVGREASADPENAEKIRTKDMKEFQNSLKTFRANLRQLYEPAAEKNE